MTKTRDTGLCVKMNESEMNMLRRVAEREGLTKAEWVRLQIRLAYRSSEEYDG